MKKILPFLSLIGASLIITGCSNNLTSINLSNTKDNLKSFYTKVNAIPQIENELTTDVVEKYNVTVDTPTTLELTEDNLVEDSSNKNETDVNIKDNNTIKENTETNNDLDAKIEDDGLSTLYSISNDVENNCDDFCQLKEKLTNAIAETERLIEKLDNNEISISREERINLSEQAMQLKNLGNQLSKTTTHLAFNLSDLKQILNENTADVNELSLKYLIVLDNLVNSNEMLQSGLTSLNMINNLLNLKGEKRLIYGYQENNNTPIIKDYSINENGEITENLPSENLVDDNKTIDSYASDPKNANIDSYYTNNRKNIDSFFNTALLDNEFMYGNKGVYGGYGYGMNPYINQYSQYEKNQKYNSNQGMNNNYYTPDIDNNTNNNVDTDGEKIGNKERKKFTITKNIDTYRDENTPDLKTRFNNFKQSITNSLNKVNPKEDIKRPIYKY